MLRGFRKIGQNSNAFCSGGQCCLWSNRLTIWVLSQRNNLHYQKAQNWCQRCNAKSTRCLSEKSIDIFLYSMAFKNNCYQKYPDRCVLDSAALTPQKKAGGGDVLEGRYDMYCSNIVYRQFVFNQLREIAQRYPDYSGFFLDMAFWPEVCYCPSRRDRFKRETGLGIPRLINLGSPE